MVVVVVWVRWEITVCQDKGSSLSAMVNVHQVSIDKAQVQQRIERKFFVIPQKLDFALLLLRQFCYPDATYPSERINSLYFDTEDLDQHERSSSGDFRKNKVRIRWYHRLDVYQETVPIFLELKSREGFASSKQRQRLLVPAHHLESVNLHKGIIPRTTLMDVLASFDYYPEAPIQPVIVISYWRYRFNELLSGMRLALDCNIRSTIVNKALGYGERELKLAGGVIEVKGKTIEIPLTLKGMRLLDIDWSRFSKYSSCLDSQLSGTGGEGRLWPSGRLIETK
jgi:hypothetical protein